MRVLIIDDEPGMLMLFEAALDSPEFECTCVGSGEEAIEVFDRGGIDVLLVDKNLPGIDGIETIRQIHQRDRNCEAVVITGYASLDSVLAAIDLRAVDYLNKPLPSIDMIPAAVRKAGRRRRRRRMVERMLSDLRHEVSVRAADSDLALLSKVRQRIDEFYARLGQSRRILFVGNEFDPLRGGPRRLKDAGFKLYRQTSGVEALSRCARGHANVVIIGDRCDDMTGVEFFDKLVDMDGHPEAVLVTAVARLKDAVDAMNRGASGYILTPLKDYEHFVRAVEQACSDQQERLYHFMLVNELNGVLAVIGDRDAHKNTVQMITTALNIFDNQTASVAVSLYASEGKGQSEWSP